MKESFVFYRSFKESMSELPDKDKLLMYEAISDYALDRTEPDLQGFSKALFRLIRPQLEANWKRYEAGVQHGWKGAEHGKKGGRPKNQKPSNNPLETLTKPANVNDNVNVNDNIPPIIPQGEEGEKSNKKKFIIPTIEEVDKYCTERKNNISGSEFVNFYASKGWMIGKNKMKEWKAAVRTWENSRKKEEKNETAKLNIITAPAE